MKALCLLITVLCAAACGVARDAGGAETDGVVAVVVVAVIPMDSERLLPHQTVVTRGGLITEVGPAARPAARRILVVDDEVDAAGALVAALGRGREAQPPEPA